MIKVINYAHRGASGYCPENTMAAFKKALELGATGIETDVQMSKDGRLVLIHDESVNRTTGGDGEIASMMLSEIQSLDAGAWFSDEFAGEKIPTLEELLDWAQPTTLTINLELKNNLEDYEGMEARVIAAVRERNMTDRIIISSFNHYSLLICKQIAPEIRTGILYMENMVDPWKYAMHIQAEALHAYYRNMNVELVEQAAANGIIYNPFTINDPQEIERLIDMGTTGIITDYPDRVHHILQSKMTYTDSDR